MTDFSKARTLLADVLDVPMATIGDTSSIETVEEWDSLAHMRLVLEIERQLKRELSPLEITDVTDVAAIEKLLNFKTDS